jgi:hypothetical protein
MPAFSRFCSLLFICCLGLLRPEMASAQSAPPQAAAAVRHTLSGQVRSGRGELLPGATVAVPALNTGMAADEQGRFSLSLPAGRHQVVVGFVGFVSQTLDVNLSRRDQTLSIVLAESNNELGEVVVEARDLAGKADSTQMGVERLSIKGSQAAARAVRRS